MITELVLQIQDNNETELTQMRTYASTQQRALAVPSLVSSRCTGSSSGEFYGRTIHRAAS